MQRHSSTWLFVTMATVAGATIFLILVGVGRHGDTLLPTVSRPVVSSSSSSSSDALLMTSAEMRRLLYNEVDAIDDRSLVRMDVSDPRYGNVIRSMMTRPDPSRPRRLTDDNQDGRYFSESDQSKLIDDRLRGRRNGLFVECGAHDGEYNSNSLFFELERNWTGLLVEPDPTAYRKLLATNRQAYVFTGCLSPTGRAMQSQFVAAGIYGGLQKDMPEKFKKVIEGNDIPFTVIPTLCFPLNDILEIIGVSHVDYLSLDIEGPELQVLEAIDWNRVRIDIMTIEIHRDWKKLNDSRLLMKRIGNYREVGLQGLDVVYERTDLNKD